MKAIVITPEKVALAAEPRKAETENIHPVILNVLRKIRDLEKEMVDGIKEINENPGPHGRFGMYVLSHGQTMLVDLLDDLECMA